MDENIREFLKRKGCREDGNKLICPKEVMTEAVRLDINMNEAASINPINDRKVEIRLKKEGNRWLE